MEWIAQLQGQVLGLDTAPLIYFMEQNPNLRSPDSIQMATAICEGASFFLTNDARLPSLPGLTVLVLENLRS
ncbi:MAG: type II toxin-antitoxin system VapC family toxin [Oscillatoriales cyanobacterium RU_3_3]|nr:type II toxin-antitoxin system VapC family toxin [Oscillatoriales cyanobacterium RU_3_3]NJR24796.1 type II toxin-antitoxin system VapC family toxin [Richelia sp. CSU_2_1]